MPAQPQVATPEIAEERAYVRAFSAGISLGLVPFNTFSKFNVIEREDGPPPIQKNSSVDPKSNRAGFGITLQVAVGNRLAIAAVPTYRKFSTHAFIEQFEGVDNSSTFIDERAKSSINEDTTGKFLELPVLLRIYNKGRKESGKRWFFEVGPTVRVASGVATTRSTITPKNETVNDNVVIPFRKNSVAATAGIGGQFIDDFGIRSIPEFRYTYWATNAFDTYHGRTRKHQFEIVLTFGF